MTLKEYLTNISITYLLMSYDKKIILITGGCGFIGSNFVRYIYQSYPSYNIINLDSLTYAGNINNLRDIEGIENSKSEKDKRYFFVKGDICDVLVLERLFANYSFDIIVHFAAESHVDRSIFSDVDFIRTNVEGTRSLVEFARRHNVGRFVHISTDEVYGSVEDGLANEDYPLRPSNPYAASKAAGDLLMQSYIKTHKLPAIIIRGSNNFGSYQYPEKLIPLAITNMIEGKPVPVHGNGVHVRSWLHVMDFCKAIDLISHNADDFTIYNVSGEEMTNLDVLHVLAKHLSVDAEQHKYHVSDRPGADIRYAPDSSKLQKDLGWKRVHTFESSIKDIVDWYMTNEEWWRAVKLKKNFLDHYERQSKGQWC